MNSIDDSERNSWNRNSHLGFFTAHIRRMTEGNNLSLFVSSHLGRGAGRGWSQVPSQPLVPCSFWGGGYPSPVTGPAWGRGTPFLSLVMPPGGGVPQDSPPPAGTGVYTLGPVIQWVVCFLRFPTEGISCVWNLSNFFWFQSTNLFAPNKSVSMPDKKTTIETFT